MFTLDDFDGRVGDTFTATAEGGRTLALTLAEADAYQGSRTRFSLVFTDTAPDHVPQQIARRSSTPRLGSFELFVVPLGPGPDGMRYEAIINT